MHDSEATAACRRCGGAVRPTATRCQHCGYDVRSHSKWRWVWGLPGTVLTVSIVGAPLGLPMLWKAYRHRKAAEGSVAD